MPGYRLTPLGDAIGAGRVDAEAAIRTRLRGFGGAAAICRRADHPEADGFAAVPAVRADPTRNLLLIQEPAPNDAAQSTPS